MLHLLAQTDLISSILPICNERHILHEPMKSSVDTSVTTNGVPLSADSEHLQNETKSENSSRRTLCQNARFDNKMGYYTI